MLIFILYQFNFLSSVGKINKTGVMFKCLKLMELLLYFCHCTSYNDLVDAAGMMDIYHRLRLGFPLVVATNTTTTTTTTTEW